MTTRKKPEVFDEPAPTNPSSEPCPYCAARLGQAHGRGCPEASAWVEAERVWREEHDG